MTTFPRAPSRYPPVQLHEILSEISSRSSQSQSPPTGEIPSLSNPQLSARLESYLASATENSDIGHERSLEISRCFVEVGKRMLEESKGERMDGVGARLEALGRMIGEVEVGLERA